MMVSPDEARAVAQLICVSAALVGGLLIAVVIANLGRPKSDRALDIQQERNQIMRDALELKRFQAYMEYSQRQAQSQSPMVLPESTSENADARPNLRKGQTHRYQRKIPTKAPIDHFPDDGQYEQKQTEHDERIERLHRYRENKRP